MRSENPVRSRGIALAAGAAPPAETTTWLQEHMPAVLRERIVILENWQWLGLLLLVVAGVILDRIVRIVVGAWVRRLLSRSAHVREPGAAGSFAKPVGILAMAFSWLLGLGLLDLPPSAQAALAFAARLVLAAAAVWAIYRLVDLVSAHFAGLAAGTETRIDDILIPLLRRAVKIIVLAFFILFVAQNLDIDITSLLAGLGIGGIAFALAAKDTVENLFGSVTVLVDRPFNIGDWVVIGDLEGTVEEIGFRSTRLRTFYNSRISIPNSTLVHSAVDNLGARRYRRVKCMIGVQYDTPPEKIDAFCEGIRELVRRHPYTRKDYYMVYFNAFGASSLDILLYVFHETPDWPTELRERHRLFVDIVRLAHRLGVQFAFPTQTLHLASVPPGLGGAEPQSPRPEEAVHAGARPLEDAVRLGRAEAEAIVRATWPGGTQAPVSFDDPERMPARHGGGPENR
jgi:MscS family membrane protein